MLVQSGLDVERIRQDFPILQARVHGKPLVYLDNGATTQKPRAVLDALARYYEEYNANVHRGVHRLSELATARYEGARETVRRFLHAASTQEIIFVRGATEGINLVAASLGRSFKAGDEIVISAMEHHSNIVPWQMLAEDRGLKLRIIPMSDEGELLLDGFEFTDRTRLVGIVHVSNALGTVNPVERIIRQAHARNIPVLVDGAQAVAHMSVDVQALDADFYVFSSHKLYGPTGTGVLYGKRALLDAMPPYQGGGDMIASVSFEKTTYNVLPYKFEAGTPNVADAIGLAAAIDYVHRVGLDSIAAHEHELLSYCSAQVASVPGVRLIGTAAHKASVVSFVMESAHPHDVGTILDQEGVAIRTGHHCAQPVMERLGIPATARASLALYNTRAEIDALVRGLHKVNEVFG
ncbi:MAG TPA: cysteine desulfurase [Candidatus Xenobia bacterium]|jgi:cysteine desulfurase/selenocysteine lyase